MFRDGLERGACLHRATVAVRTHPPLTRRSLAAALLTRHTGAAGSDTSLEPRVSPISWIAAGCGEHFITTSGWSLVSRVGGVGVGGWEGGISHPKACIQFYYCYHDRRRRNKKRQSILLSGAGGGSLAHCYHQVEEVDAVGSRVESVFTVASSPVRGQAAEVWGNKYRHPAGTPDAKTAVESPRNPITPVGH